MALTPHYLMDTSVAARLGQRAVATRLRPLIERGLVATCGLLDLEAGYAAQNDVQWQQITKDRALLYPWVPIPEDAFEKARQLQGELVRNGTHRGVGVADLLIAVTAAFHDLTVLHYDHDFDLIVATGAVSAEWVVPSGVAP